MIGQGLTSLAGHDPLALNPRMIMNPIVTTVTLRHEAVQGAALVGKTAKIKTDAGPFALPYKIHSVEGHDWYAFDQDGQVTIDDNMTPVAWISNYNPTVTLIPEGSKIGEGFSRTVNLYDLSIVS